MTDSFTFYIESKQIFIYNCLLMITMVNREILERLEEWKREEYPSLVSRENSM